MVRAVGEVVLQARSRWLGVACDEYAAVTPRLVPWVGRSETRLAKM